MLKTQYKGSKNTSCFRYGYVLYLTNKEMHISECIFYHHQQLVWMFHFRTLNDKLHGFHEKQWVIYHYKQLIFAQSIKQERFVFTRFLSAGNENFKNCKFFIRKTCHIMAFVTKHLTPYHQCHLQTAVKKYIFLGLIQLLH